MHFRGGTFSVLSHIYINQLFCQLTLLCSLHLTNLQPWAFIRSLIPSIPADYNHSYVLCQFHCHQSYMSYLLRCIFLLVPRSFRHLSITICPLIRRFLTECLPRGGMAALALPPFISPARASYPTAAYFAQSTLFLSSMFNACRHADG